MAKEKKYKLVSDYYNGCTSKNGHQFSISKNQKEISAEYPNRVAAWECVYCGKVTFST